MLRFVLFALLLVFRFSALPAQNRSLHRENAADFTARHSTETFAKVIKSRIDELLQGDLSQQSQIGLYVYDLTADTALYRYGHRQLLRPASTMKLLTAIVALDRLGSDYKLSTNLYATASPIDTLLPGHIIVKGGFDPLFGRDDLRAMVAHLSKKGIRRIGGDIILDRSLKDTATLGWGWCWDDREPPLTPLAYRGRETLAAAFQRSLAAAGIAFDGQMRHGLLPDSATLLVSRSHNIDQILHPMMKRSDNFYAESLFYHLAAQSAHPYADRKQAVKKFERFFSSLGLQSSDYQVADGSGLSLYNYLTPELLVCALRYAYLNEEIYNHLLPSLPVMGRDGTLRRRCIGTSAQGNVRAKTGTVEGITSLAGYALAANGHQLCFAVINQGLLRSSVGRRFQDRLCRALTEDLPQSKNSPDSLALPAEKDIIAPSSDDNVGNPLPM